MIKRLTSLFFILSIFCLLTPPPAEAKNLGLKGDPSNSFNKKGASGTAESSGDGRYPKGTFYDPTGIIIGFNVNNLCDNLARALNVGGETLQLICLELYNCLRGRDNCKLKDCFNAIKGGCDDSSDPKCNSGFKHAYEVCKVLCSLVPNLKVNVAGEKIKVCQSMRCISELFCGPVGWDTTTARRTGQCDTENRPNGLFYPPSDMCCSILLSPTKIFLPDGDEIPKLGPLPGETAPPGSEDENTDSSPISYQSLVNACTTGASVFRCIAAIKEAPNGIESFPPFTLFTGDPTSTDIIDKCCNERVFRAFEVTKNTGESNNISVRNLCAYMDVFNCAAVVSNGVQNAVNPNKNNNDKPYCPAGNANMDYDPNSAEGERRFFANLKAKLEAQQSPAGDFGKYCCKKRKSIARVSKWVEKGLDPACTIVDIYQCTGAIARAFGQTGHGIGENCKCEVAESCETKGEETNTTCNPGNVEPLAGNDLGDPNPIYTDCPVTADGTYQTCTADCSYDKNKAKELLDWVRRIGLRPFHEAITGPRAIEIADSCCGESIGRAIFSIAPEAQEVIGQVCNTFQVTQCLTAITADLGIGGHTSCMCEDGITPCTHGVDSNGNPVATGQPNPSCNVIVDGAVIQQQECSKCGPPNIGGFLKDLLAIQQKDDWQRKLGTGAPNIRAECCDPSKGIGRIMYNISDEWGNVTQDICGALQLQSCAAVLLHKIPDAICETGTNVECNAAEDNKQNDLIDLIINGITAVKNVVNDMIDPPNASADTQINTAAKEVELVNKNCCSTETLSAAEVLSTDFGKNMDKVCSIISVKACLSSMANYVGMGSQAFDTKGSSQPIQTLLDNWRKPGFGDDIWANMFPTSQGIMRNCCGVTVTDDGQLQPSRNAVEDVRKINPDLGNILEGVCHAFTAVNCITEVDRMVNFPTSNDGSGNPATKSCKSGKDKHRKTCVTDADCDSLQEITCSVVSPTAQSASAGSSANCSEGITEPGECGTKKDNKKHQIKAFMNDFTGGTSGSESFNLIKNYGVLPERFDKFCCNKKAYDAFNYIQNDIFNSSKTKPNRIGDYLQGACSFDAVFQCAANLTQVAVNAGSSFNINANSGASGTVNELLDVLNTLTDQTDQNGISKKCCDGRALIGSKALFPPNQTTGELSPISKTIQTTCDVMELLECTSTTIAFGSDSWNNIDTAKTKLLNKDFTQLDSLDSGSFAAFDKHCCKDIEGPITRLFKTTETGNAQGFIDGFQKFCKAIKIGRCVAGVAEGAAKIWQESAIPGAFKKPKFDLTSTASTGDPVDEDTGVVDTGGVNFMQKLQAAASPALTVLDKLKQIPGLMSQCCEVMPSFIDSYNAVPFLSKVTGKMCQGDAECTKGPLHAIMCAITFGSQRASTGKKFAMARCCEYVDQLNTLPFMSDIFLNDTITCSNNPPSSQCYELVNTNTDERGVSCQWVFKPEVTNAAGTVITDDRCLLGTVVDFKTAEPPYNAKPTDLTSINELHCKCCNFEFSSPLEIFKTVRDAVKCTGMGCGPGWMVQDGLTCVAPKCDGCSPDDLYTQRNAGTITSSPPLLKSCDPTIAITAAGANDMQCSNFNWTDACKDCSETIYMSDEAIINQYFNQGGQEKYCSFEMKKCVKIKAQLNNQGTPENSTGLVLH